MSSLPGTPIWRRLKTLAFYLDSDIFKYEGIDAKGKKLVTVIIPFAQVNSIQTWSRRIKKLKTKSEMKNTGRYNSPGFKIIDSEY
jgi:hypothetical protein